MAHSAGSRPSGAVRPEALNQLQSVGVPTEGLRSKSWDEFAKPGAPELNFIFTVCDNAASEACPYWPGQPITAHWGVPDPAAVKGTPDEIARAFHDAYLALEHKIALFLALQIATLENVTLQQELKRIGHQ